MLRRFSLTSTAQTSVVKLANVNPYRGKICLVVPLLVFQEPDTCCRYCSLAPKLKGFLMYWVYSSLVTNLEKPIAVFSFSVSISLLYLEGDLLLVSEHISIHHSGQVSGLFLLLGLLWVITPDNYNHRVFDSFTR